MQLRARHLLLLLVLAGISSADSYVTMPEEVGVSCRKHKPFTAVARTTLKRIFSSGAERTVTFEDRIARDADGRVLREQHFPWTEDPAKPVYYTNILDPIAMERLHIDPQKRTVLTEPVNRRYTWDYVPYDGTQYRIATGPGVTVHTERLANLRISGLECSGQRTEFVFPPGTYKGNQQTVTRIWEVWYSEELGSDVRIVKLDPDPKAGYQQTDLVDIRYAEPAPSIFTPPDGYSLFTGRQ